MTGLKEFDKITKEKECQPDDKKELNDLFMKLVKFWQFQ